MTKWSELATSGAALGGGTDGWVNGDGVRLHYVERGSGPLVVLLHGFPDFWFGWRHQLGALAALGFRAVALDLRGYNLSGRPSRVEDYALKHLVADVAAAIAQLGGRAHAVVGHDWGGVVAWHLSTERPELMQSLAVLNAPHPARFRELLTTSTQCLRSWYVAAVQIPYVPERVLRWRDGTLLIAALRATHARRESLGAGELEAYRAAFRSPDAVWAALAYYRALARHARWRADGARQHTPHRTLVVWGQNDVALVPANATRLDRWVPGVHVVRVPAAGHFVQVDAPDAVNDALAAFLEA